MKRFLFITPYFVRHDEMWCVTSSPISNHKNKLSKRKKATIPAPFPHTQTVSLTVKLPQRQAIGLPSVVSICRWSTSRSATRSTRQRHRFPEQRVRQWWLPGRGDGLSRELTWRGEGTRLDEVTRRGHTRLVISSCEVMVKLRAELHQVKIRRRSVLLRC